MQGFPDNFKIPVSDTQAYRQFGNSVVVPLMADIAKLVRKKMQEMDAMERNEKKISGNTKTNFYKTEKLKQNSANTIKKKLVMM